MRIVIDMQGAQTESRIRGIGHHTLSFAQAIARNRGEHEVILALSGLFPDTIESMRAAFDGLLPQENIRVWYAPGPVRALEAANTWRREAAELIREAFLASLKPDVILISGLFEGYTNDAVSSIGRLDTTTPVSVFLHDPIALCNPGHHHNHDISYEQYYLRKVDYLNQAACFFSTSELSRQEWIGKFNISESSVVNVLAGIEPLGGESCRDTLRAHGLRQAQQFSEFELARKVIVKLESLVAERKGQTASCLPQGRKPRLAFVSPLPPERTGIADYSAELLPALAEYYDIDVVVAQDQVDVLWDSCHCNIRDVQWLRSHAAEFDRVLYQIGNSPFHQHMLPLMREVPGAVVLHDFFIGHLIAWLEHVGAAHAWAKALYVSHGYDAVRERYRDAELAKLKFPVNLDVLLPSEGVIVHSEYSRDLARQWYGNSLSVDWEVIPLLRSPAGKEDRVGARQALGIDPDDFVVCSFGFLGPSKLNHSLLDAWLASCLAKDPRCKLIFVGENHGGDYGEALLERIRLSKKSSFIRITGFASQEVYRNYLAAADMAVQLRAASRGETSAAVLDSMNYALPLVVNANGSMAELDPEAVYMLPDEFDDAVLVEALEFLWQNPERRSELSERAREIIRSRHTPAACARDYAEAIEHFHQRAESATPALIRAIAAQKDFTPNEIELQQFAKAISSTLPLMRPAKRLLLDISATCRTDLKTGIERVARALLLALLDAPPEGYRVEPVYLSDAGGEWKYHYARRYTLGLLGCPVDALHDEIVAPESGDVLLGLDLSGDLLIQADRAGLFANYRNLGVEVYFTVFDLLPVQMPEVFPPGADKSHATWLRVVSGFDGAICISKAVADDLAAWLEAEGVHSQGRRPFQISWFHLGADVANSAPSLGFPNNAEWTLEQLRKRPSFLMVGTVEPRKGYLQAIEAFTRIWKGGGDVNLVIVGKEGWKGLPDEARRNIPETIDCLNNHSELGKRLFWLEGISDEYLEKVYAASTCLITASYGEGFGLPLIESAQHKLPIIARDIPVFREVAGEYAYYFKGVEPESLAEIILGWLQSYKENRHPGSDKIRWLTWRDSGSRLLSLLLYK